MTNSFRSSFILFLFSAVLLSCGKQAPQKSTEKKPIGTIESQYAEGFAIRQYEGYTRVSIFNAFQDQPDTLTYNLVPRGEPMPQDVPEGQLVRTPVERMIATSTTHLALTDMLDANEVIAGMVSAQYAYNSEIRNGIEQGEITPFNEGEFNNEVALNMEPDLVMVSAGQSSQYENYRLLVDSGIAVFVNAEWLERTPLGKAEWLKVMGALLEKEAMATRKFAEVARRYEELKAKAEKMPDSTLVINNMPYKGAWFVPGGNSFTAQFLKDAGADYPWYDNPSTGGLRLDFEAVYEAGLRADVWLNPGTAVTKEDVVAADPRFRDFNPFKNDRIYNNNKRMSPAGGNDFWETGVVRPDLILSDLITILHSESVENDSLYFYQKVK